MYGMRWINMPQHPAARAGGSFGHSASAAAARQGRTGACESLLPSNLLLNLRRILCSHSVGPTPVVSNMAGKACRLVRCLTRVAAYAECRLFAARGRKARSLEGKQRMQHVGYVGPGNGGPSVAPHACGLLLAGSSEAAQSSAACAPRRLPAAHGVADAAVARRAGRVAHGGRAPARPAAAAPPAAGLPLRCAPGRAAARLAARRPYPGRHARGALLLRVGMLCVSLTVPCMWYGRGVRAGICHVEVNETQSAEPCCA